MSPLCPPSVFLAFSYSLSFSALPLPPSFPPTLPVSEPIFPSPSSPPPLSPFISPSLPPSTEIPVLWVRVDPEFLWLRLLTMEQADTVWHCLLKYERDANAQLEVCVCVCVCVCMHVRTLLEPKCVPFQSMKYFSNVLNSRVSFPVLALWPGNETTRQGSYSHMHTRCRLLRH